MINTVYACDGYRQSDIYKDDDYNFRLLYGGYLFEDFEPRVEGDFYLNMSLENSLQFFRKETREDFKIDISYDEMEAYAFMYRVPNKEYLTFSGDKQIPFYPENSNQILAVWPVIKGNNQNILENIVYQGNIMMYFKPYPSSKRHSHPIWSAIHYENKKDYETRLKDCFKGFDYYWEVFETPYPELMEKTSYLGDRL